MNGLEKMMERILAEGREKARVILQEAEADCVKIATDYAARAEAVRREILEKTEQDATQLVEDAKAEALALHDQILADARRSVMDDVIAGAKEKLCSTHQNKYRDLLIALLTSALIEQDKAEREQIAAGNTPVAAERFEVLMNALDCDTFGADVVNKARHLIERRIGADKAARIVLAHERISIDGGLILRYGDTLVDCSIDTLLRRIFSEMEDELTEHLFG